ncbi:unnamed protein product [Linum trigynum]|uniref:Zinc knuckle CX2CX4HX4C domain-containing protein n=1 Tax=Linum trigynum TaxID=586398 RepID=A0AAV2CUV4_9ROSI
MGVAEGRYVSFIRVLVGIDLSESLPHGFFLEDDSSLDLWVEFKYKRLPTQVFYCCGRIGHNQLMCRSQSERIEGRYMDWIRAGHPTLLSQTPRKTRLTQRKVGPTTTSWPQTVQ